MKPLISLSTTEAECIALSAALCEFTEVKNLLSELQSQNSPIPNTAPRGMCKVFEDNKSCIDIANNHKTQARTENLSVRLNRFRKNVVNKTIQIEHI